MSSTRAPGRPPSTVLTIFGFLATAIFLLPVIWMVSTALKTNADAFRAVPVWFFDPTLDNFRAVLSRGLFGRFLSNSAIAALSSTAFALVLGASLAYPLARLKIPGARHIAFWILSLRILPPIVIVLPIFVLFSQIGLSGSLVSLVILYTFMNLPLATWLLISFFSEIPEELEHAAMVDGAGRIRAFVSITLPLSFPGLIATGTLTTIFAWNEFLFANILTGALSRTAPVALTQYVTPVGIQWTEIMAAGTLVVLPVWIGALAVQRYLVRGLTMGALK
jgi:multiple sugar transport system permease protein